MVRGIPFACSQPDRQQSLSDRTQGSDNPATDSQGSAIDASSCCRPGQSRHDRASSIPARMRGEQFNQKSLLTYSFFGNTVIGNLLAMQNERLIVVQFDVAQQGASPAGDWVPLCDHRGELAETFLRQLRRRLDSVWMKAFRRVRGLPSQVEIEGPFIPHQNGIALMMLAIRVYRDGNYDAVHRRVRRFLELNQHNDDFDSHLSSWYPQLAPLPDSDTPDPGYPWTVTEFDSIEKMARLESATGRPEFDLQSMANRRRYNDDLLEQAQSRQPRESTLGDSDAASAANQILRDFFVGPIGR